MRTLTSHYLGKNGTDDDYRNATYITLMYTYRNQYQALSTYNPFKQGEPSLDPATTRRGG